MNKIPPLEDIQRARCFRSPVEGDSEIVGFEYFLRFVKILVPPTATNAGGRMDFEMWDHLIDMVGVLETNRLITVLKSRQVGLSWILAAYALWRAIFHEGSVILILSQGQIEAQNFLGKSRYIHSELPPHLQQKVGSDSTTQMTFPGMKSKLTALPSTEHAGRGETASLVVWDEADFHEYLEPNYAAIKPTVDQGGQLIQVSTRNKEKMTSLFIQLYRDAPGNGFTKRFYGWRVHPERDDKWYAQRKKEAPTTAKMSPDFYMEQEFPGTEEEALAQSRVLAYFDQGILQEMEQDNRSPVRVEGKIINIYQEYSVGKRYIAGSDVAHGVGGDASVTVVIDVATGYIVADINSSLIPPEELAMWSVRMLKQYDNPKWGIEDNEWGILTIRKAQELGYRNLYEHHPDVAGWHTGEQTRYILWGELLEAVTDRLITIPSKAGLGEFYSVIRNPDPKKGGKVEAVVGAHDDYPMATGIAWQMRKYSYARNLKVTSTRWGDQNPRHTIGVGNAAP